MNSHESDSGEGLDVEKQSACAFPADEHVGWAVDVKSDAAKEETDSPEPRRRKRKYASTKLSAVPKTSSTPGKILSVSSGDSVSHDLSRSQSTEQTISDAVAQFESILRSDLAEKIEIPLMEDAPLEVYSNPFGAVPREQQQPSNFQGFMCYFDEEVQRKISHSENGKSSDGNNGAKDGSGEKGGGGCEGAWMDSC